MPFEYAYITSCLILSIFWLLIYLQRKSLRQEMLWASFIAIPFGFIDYFLVPIYWNPDSLFNLIKQYGVGIESFIFMFLMAGTASVIYEFLLKKRPIKIREQKHLHFLLIIFLSLYFVAMSIIFPSKTIYNFMIAGAIGAIVTAYIRKDLIKQMLASAFVFSLFYLGVFILINLMFPGFVEYSYNLKNTWGILLLGVPAEEIAVAFFVGAFWSTAYEYTKSYRD